MQGVVEGLASFARAVSESVEAVGERFATEVAILNFDNGIVPDKEEDRLKLCARITYGRGSDQEKIDRLKKLVPLMPNLRLIYDQPANGALMGRVHVADSVFSEVTEYDAIFVNNAALFLLAGAFRQSAHLDMANPDGESGVQALLKSLQALGMTARGYQCESWYVSGTVVGFAFDHVTKKNIELKNLIFQIPHSEYHEKVVQELQDWSMGTVGSLSTVGLSGERHIRPIEEAGFFQPLLHSLNTSTALKTLEMSIDNSEVIFDDLNQLVQNLACLKTLRLDWHKNTDTSSNLLSTLQNTSSLTELKLKGDWVDGTIEKGFYAQLKFNRSLRSLVVELPPEHFRGAYNSTACMNSENSATLDPLAEQALFDSLKFNNTILQVAPRKSFGEPKIDAWMAGNNAVANKKREHVLEVFCATMAYPQDIVNLLVDFILLQGHSENVKRTGP